MDLSDVEPKTPLTSGYHGRDSLSDSDLAAHLDVASLRQKVLTLEILLSSKDQIILKLENLVEDLKSRVDKIEREILKSSSTQCVQQPCFNNTSWVTVASRALAQVEGKKLDRPAHQIEINFRRNVLVFVAPMSNKKTKEAQDSDDKGFIEKTFRAIKADCI
ncbi:hypothetical protein BpHYR1_000960 [Brachionus plicatilis]|uniref:Uncharacterized protein n=1 Tax=Brachionus plicatilis TaxID=10195 RepID=A0A3M7RDU6_BRAPC|nr:hypothetical protein BpHYR1_000960 [Brachionus plicatilis]